MASPRRGLPALLALLPHEHGASLGYVVVADAALAPVDHDDDARVVCGHQAALVMLVVFDRHIALDRDLAPDGLFEMSRAAQFALKPR